MICSAWSNSVCLRGPMLIVLPAIFLQTFARKRLTYATVLSYFFQLEKFSIVIEGSLVVWCKMFALSSSTVCQGSSKFLGQSCSSDHKKLGPRNQRLLRRRSGNFCHFVPSSATFCFVDNHLHSPISVESSNSLTR